MKLTFAKEPLFPYLWNECLPLFRHHYDEINMNKAIKLDPDENIYRELAKIDFIEVHTARAHGVLVGYSFFLIHPHLHYKGSLTALNDLVYLAPECRRGWNGYRLIKFSLEKIKERNPQRIMFHVKPFLDFGRILERLGARLFENIYSITLEV